MRRIAAGLLAVALAAACSSKSSTDRGSLSGACLSDKDCRAEGRLCDPLVAACVQCLRASDCGMNADCTSGACVAFEPCVNSLACKSGKVCDTARSRCVACLTDSDCGSTFHCVANVCRPSCQSDKDCTAMKELCDPSTLTCAECVRTTDCATGKICSGGICAYGVCIPGSTSCAANTLFVCAATGTAWQTAATCPVACRETSDGGFCSDGG